MSIPFLPNISIKHFLSLTDRDADSMPSPWKNRSEDNIFYFSRGQWALKAFGDSAKKTRNKNKYTIFVPEYFCEISLTPLRKDKDCRIVFYKLNDSLAPEITHLDELLKEFGCPDILLCVHYFGFLVKLAEIKNWCARNGVLLVEDAAHSLLPLPGSGENPAIYAPWKFLNLKQGALLVLPESDKLEQPSTQNNASLSNNAAPLLWGGRQIIIQTLRAIGIPLHRFFKREVKQPDESEIPEGSGGPRCSDFFLNILMAFQKELRSIKNKRLRNYRVVDGVFRSGALNSHRLFKNIPEYLSPYLYPLKISTEHSHSLMVQLNEKGIPALPWSDLSPEVKGNKKFTLSNTLRRSIITLPIHQNLTESQCLWMADVVVNKENALRKAAGK